MSAANTNIVAAAASKASILIVGGGIAGPSVALALRRALGDAPTITLLEGRARGDVALEAGGGFTLSANALRAVSAIGIAPVVLEAGSTPTFGNKMYNGTGKLLGTLPIGDPVALHPRTTGATAAAAAAVSVPGLTLRRCGMAQKLLQAAAAANVTVEFGKRVSKMADLPDGTCMVECVDGTAYAAGLVIGCDGIRSAVRRHIDPSATVDGDDVHMLNFGGVMSPQAIADANVPPAFLEKNFWHMAFGKTAFFGFLINAPLPTSDAALIQGPRGLDGATWFVNVAPEAFDLRRDAAQDASQLADLFKDDLPHFGALLRGATLDVARLQTRALPSVAHWHLRRCVIIGDAAHAPSPTSGQGAGMALEDAQELAMAIRDATKGHQWIGENGDQQCPPIPMLAQAFSTFEKSRRARVERIVSEATKMSKHKNPTSAFGRWMRDKIMANLVLPMVAKSDQSKAVFDYSVDFDSSLAEQVARRSNNHKNLKRPPTRKNSVL